MKAEERCQGTEAATLHLSDRERFPPARDAKQRAGPRNENHVCRGLRVFGDLFCDKGVEGVAATQDRVDGVDHLLDTRGLLGFGNSVR